MFKSSISATPLTSDAADLFFQNITGESYGSDVTFLATLRALVAPRMPEGESISLSFGRSDYNAAVIAETPAKRMVEMICGNMYICNGQIYIHNLANRDEANNVANVELLKSKFTEVYDGWQLVERVSDFYQKSFKVICFVSPDTKSVALFVEQLNLQKLHYLQMATLAILPWYFDTKNGIEEIELELLKSLRERSSAHYEECLKKIAAKHDFESARIKKLLAGFETKFERMECERVQRDIRSVDSEMAEMNRRYADFLRKRNDLCIHLLGLERRIEEGGSQSEIMDYFLCNRRLVLENITNTRMRFSVRDYLTYFDEDAAKTYINNQNGYFYRNCSSGSSGMNRSNMEKLLKAIFLDQELRVRFCAAYEFDLNGSVSARDGHSFGSEFDGYMPNPHIQHYACIGNYQKEINEALKKRDYIFALEQCIASAKSLNFHDAAVMSRFAEDFTRSGGSAFKCIELPDGTVVCQRDAIKWLEAQESAAKPTENKVYAPADTSARAPAVPAGVAERIREEANANTETPAEQEEVVPF